MSTALGTLRPAPRATARRLAVAVTALAGAAFVALGLAGTYGYLWNYWLYRGYAPPSDPAFVRLAGTTQKLTVTSPALGGRRQSVYVYLPPGYAQHAHRRYPVLYLMHGFPGRPLAFLLTVRAGVDEDVLVARGQMRPLILVMPSGSTGTFTDKEWANGVRRHEAWESFLARDVVSTVDRRYRTIRSGAGRALAGLSEGGYAALNIGLHHPREFRVLESWSGYERADNLRSVFGGNAVALADNSPLLTVRHVAPLLRRRHVYLWFYSGREDPLRVQNAEFSRELERLHVAHRYFTVAGGHNWALWRDAAARALMVASRGLSHA